MLISYAGFEIFKVDLFRDLNYYSLFLAGFLIGLMALLRPKAANENMTGGPLSHASDDVWTEPGRFSILLTKLLGGALMAIALYFLINPL